MNWKKISYVSFGYSVSALVSWVIISILPFGNSPLKVLLYVICACGMVKLIKQVYKACLVDNAPKYAYVMDSTALNPGYYELIPNDNAPQFWSPSDEKWYHCLRLRKISIKVKARRSLDGAVTIDAPYKELWTRGCFYAIVPKFKLEDAPRFVRVNDEKSVLTLDGHFDPGIIKNLHLV